MSGSLLIEHFGAVKDPRQSWKVLFPLPEVLLLVLCGTLAGAEDFVEIRRWGHMHQDFLRRLLPFKAGIPSHDTLNNVINAIDGASLPSALPAHPLQGSTASAKNRTGCSKGTALNPSSP